MDPAKLCPRCTDDDPCDDHAEPFVCEGCAIDALSDGVDPRGWCRGGDCVNNCVPSGARAE